ncbi:MAG TPA: hypothetical protein VGK80_01420 [Rhodanobacteraceae bacterium]
MDGRFLIFAIRDDRKNESRREACAKVFEIESADIECLPVDLRVHGRTHEQTLAQAAAAVGKGP